MESPLLRWVVLGVALGAGCAVRASLAGPVFTVSVEPALAPAPLSGRLLVFLIRDGSSVGDRAEPIDGPFWEDPQPLFGKDVAALDGAHPVVIGAGCDAFPVAIGALPAGKYRAQARLDAARTSSHWRVDAENLFGEPVRFEIQSGGPDVPVELKLTQRAGERLPENLMAVTVATSPRADGTCGPGVTVGIVPPIGYDPSSGRRYAAIYEVPGFGGTHTDAARRSAARMRLVPGTPEYALAENTFLFILNPESKNGHTLFADSANNGPCGRELVEAVASLEQIFPLIAEPSARLLRGHSSGGWSTLWLALNYPETFGATWSTSPDPVDFRRFQLVDIYGQENFFTDAAGKEIASLRRGGKDVMTVRQENGGEQIVGPDNTSAQQWDSWFAVFGPRNERGHPAALFDPVTGVIDHTVAERYRAYDIGHLLRTQTARFAPIFRERVRIIVGSEDSFFLNEAVALLKEDLERLAPSPAEGGSAGYVKIVPGDHGGVFSTPEMQAIPKEMLEHLTRAGHVKQP